MHEGDQSARRVSNRSQVLPLAFGFNDPVICSVSSVSHVLYEASSSPPSCLAVGSFVRGRSCESLNIPPLKSEFAWLLL